MTHASLSLSLTLKTVHFGGKSTAPKMATTVLHTKNLMSHFFPGHLAGMQLSTCIKDSLQFLPCAQGHFLFFLPVFQEESLLCVSCCCSVFISTILCFHLPLWPSPLLHKSAGSDSCDPGRQAQSMLGHLWFNKRPMFGSSWGL